jgi:twinfilin
MVYSTGFNVVYVNAREFIKSSSDSVTLAAKKIQTSEPSEVDEQFFISELGLDTVTAGGGDASASAEDSGTSTPSGEKKPFARPKGPARRPR